MTKPSRYSHLAPIKATQQEIEETILSAVPGRYKKFQRIEKEEQQ